MAAPPNPPHGGAPDYEELVSRSRNLLFPADEMIRELLRSLDNRIESAQEPDVRAAMAAHAAAARPVVHSEVLAFMAKFIAHKRGAGGTPIERALYATLTVDALVARLLRERPLMFMNPSDQFVLKSGEYGDYGAADFDAIGTAAEAPPFQLASLISYDEMQLSALIGVASPCHFINTGGRGNQGRGAPGPGAHEPTGVYVGQVGCRFEREHRMEWQHMVVDPVQNVSVNGYGVGPVAGGGPGSVKRAILMEWASLYRTANFPLHASVVAAWDANVTGARARWVPIQEWNPQRRFFDLAAFQGRCIILAKSFLLEANYRAALKSAEEGRVVRAYCHAVGLGLGVWNVAPQQRFILIDAFKHAVEECDLPFVSEIDFAWMQERETGLPWSCGGVAVSRSTGDATLRSTRFATNAVTFRFSKRDPADPLVGPHEGKLLVAQFAWDSNAYVGNEYWSGMLAASGDPAAACCSTIAELFVPEINPAAMTLRGSVDERSAGMSCAAGQVTDPDL